MARKIIGTNWDRDNRNNMNDNFEELYKTVDNMTDTISEEAFEKVVDSARLIWQTPVDTYEDIATTYPNPEEGWVVMCREDSADYPTDDSDMRKAGTVWRYDGSDWKAIQQIDPTMINEVEDRLNQKINDDVGAVNKKLDKLVQDIEQIGTTTFERMDGQIVQIVTPTETISFNRDDENVIQSVNEIKNDGTIKTTFERDDEGTIRKIDREMV